MNELGRIVFFVLYPLVWLYVRVVRVPRVRVIIFSPSNNVLLVRSWFGQQRWSLPGGGIGHGESARDAAVREVFEETGVKLDATHVRDAGEVRLKEGIAMDYQLFVASYPEERLPKLSGLRQLEIIDRAWVPSTEVPAEIRQIINKRV